MSSAFEGGYRVVAVLPGGMIHLGQSAQEFLIRNSVEVISPAQDGKEWRILKSCISQVVEEAVLLEPAMATRLVIEKLKEATQDTTSGKGALLEQALSLASSQIPGWRVRSSNFRTTNEELDLVVANSSAKAPWNGTSFIIVEAKNWSH